MGDFPRRVDIETTNACNLKCPMCARTTAMNRDVGHMSPDLFRRIADEVGDHDVDLVWLHIFGEPLLNPRIFEYIDYIRRSDRIGEVGMSTNVTTLGERHARTVLASRLDRIILAVDAASAGAYASARGGSFAKVVANVERFLRLRRDLGSRMQVEISLIPMAMNEADMEAFRARWEPWAGDGVEVLFKPFTDFAGQVEYLGAEGDWRARPLARKPCAAIWEGLSIHVHGGVVACCYDVNGTLHLGSLRRQTIEEIWNGDRLRRLRDAHSRLDFSGLPLCENCLESRA